MDLIENEVHCWLTKVDEIPFLSLLEKYKNLLSRDEKRKIDGYRFLSSKNEALIARAMLRYVLSMYGEILPEHWHFDIGKNGKPKVSAGQTGPQFNISHSGGVIAIAISLQGEVGVDVEEIVDDGDLLKVASRYFAVPEYLDLRTVGDSYCERFFEYWTLKESYIKATGAGLSIPLNSFYFTIGASESGRVNANIQLTHNSHESNDKDWQSWLIYLSDTHRMAITVAKSVVHGKMRFFSCAPLISCTEITSSFD